MCGLIKQCFLKHLIFFVEKCMPVHFNKKIYYSIVELEISLKIGTNTLGTPFLVVLV